jgi:predicted ABC-type ATPase
MTSKEIFEAIDLEKVGPELKTKLLALEKATEGFTNERADARMETSMNAVYNFIKDKKPEALKNVEVKTVTVEETITKTQGGKKVSTKKTIRKKVAGKRKKNTKKTPTPSAKNPMPNVPQIAREIREEGESWSDALSRAKVIYNKKKDDQKVKAKKALDDLRDFMKSDKFLKGWPRTYGKENAGDNDLERDLARPAQAPGRRISKTGRVYYENRDNRSDREANAFPRKIYLEKGGYVAVSENDGYWYIMSTPTTKDKAQEVIDMGVPRGEVGKVVTLEQAKAYNKVIGRQYLELGGEVMVQPTILQNNPDYLTSTATMGEWFEKGGKISSSTTYVSNRSIKELSITLGKSLKKLKGADIVDGVYVKNDALNTTKITSLNSVDAILDDIVSMANLKGSKRDIKSVKKDDIQKLLDAGYDREDLITIYFGPTSLANVNIDNDIDLGLLGLDEYNVQNGIKKLLEVAKSKTYEIGLKYPDFNWSDILTKYKIDKNGKDVNGVERISNNNADKKTFYVYRIFEGNNVVVGTSVDRVEIIKGKKVDDDSYRKDPNDLKKFKGGYWSIVSSDKKIIKDIAKMILRKKSGYVKNMDIFVNDLGGVSAQTLDFNKIPYELGGEVMVQPTILQNNPDYITSTTTMSELFAKGGYVDLQANLMKELQKLQRELNSPRLSRYTEGDNSQEEIARKRERASKLNRFNEILDLLRELESKKMAKGGAMEHMVFKGDKVLAIHRNMVIVESDLGSINVLDFRTEPIARRILVEPITGKNTLASAIYFIDDDPSFKTTTMAMGGSLQGHGLEEGDLIIEDLGSSIMVLSEDGKTFYVDLREGERYTEEPLPFEHGGEVKIGDIARLAAKYNKTGQEVAAAISEGADVEVEHTEDRKRAMRIAVDHLDEDFYYYPKLKAAEGQPDFSDFYEKGGQVPEQFLDSNGERKIDAKSIEELTDYVMALPQTKSIYFNESTQEYVPSRRKLHADIINKFKEEVVCITEGQPIAIFMGGSPASGKSSFLRKYSPYLLKEEILKVDADEIRAMLPEYDGYNAAQTHLETKDIVNTLLSNKNIGIPCDFDLIYDGTMNSVKSYIPLMDILRKRGYKIFIVYMDKVPKDVIIKRALERYKKSGRFVPLEVIEDFFEKGKTAFNDLKKDVDGYMVIDGSNQDYEIIEKGGIKLPTNREYSKLGTKIDPKDIPAIYKKGGKTKNG